jgi:hypothetical protein
MQFVRTHRTETPNPRVMMRPMSLKKTHAVTELNILFMAEDLENLRKVNDEKNSRDPTGQMAIGQGVRFEFLKNLEDADDPYITLNTNHTHHTCIGAALGMRTDTTLMMHHCVDQFKGFCLCTCTLKTFTPLIANIILPIGTEAVDEMLNYYDTTKGSVILKFNIMITLSKLHDDIVNLNMQYVVPGESCRKTEE